MTWRNTAFDAAGVQVLLDPPWLLAPLFLRDGLPVALLPDWSRWWSAAVGFRPGGPAPRQQDLIDSPDLARRWGAREPSFDDWLARRGPADNTRPIEQELLASFGSRHQHAPAPRTLTVLVVPYGADLFRRPQADRLVVDAALRLSGDRYRQLVDPVLADFF